MAEGLKTVLELLQAGWKTELLFTTEESLIEELGPGTELISGRQMSQISSLKTASPVLGVFEIPADSEIDFSEGSSRFNTCGTVPKPYSAEKTASTLQTDHLTNILRKNFVSGNTATEMLFSLED